MLIIRVVPVCGPVADLLWVPARKDLPIGVILIPIRTGAEAVLPSTSVGPGLIIGGVADAVLLLENICSWLL